MGSLCPQPLSHPRVCVPCHPQGLLNPKKGVSVSPAPVTSQGLSVPVTSPQSLFATPPPATRRRSAPVARDVITVRQHPPAKMAAPTGTNSDGVAARYCLVSGIPAALRSAQLRAYFSQFLEAGGFLCFHYRHRPERPPAGGGGASAPRTCSCLVSVRPGRARRFVRMYSGKRWVGPGGAALPGRCLIRRVRLSPGTGTGGGPGTGAPGG